MRVLPAVILLLSLPVACTPYLPARDDFGTSAAAPAGEVPPEFAEFNQIDPAVNPLLANQLCATQYQLREEKPLGALPGMIVQARGRCRTHIPLFEP
jgi:hypothetical protein